MAGQSREKARAEVQRVQGKIERAEGQPEDVREERRESFKRAREAGLSLAEIGKEEKPEAPAYSEDAEALITLLERVTRAYKRTTILYEGDQRLQSLFGSPVWLKLKSLLIEHGIVVEESRESRGANVPAYRLRVNVDELLAGQTAEELPQSSTAGLWQDLRAM